MTTTEGNRIIAEFMGAKYTHDFHKSYAVFSPVTFGDMQGDYSCDDKDLRFHLSWGWQIPAWSKAIQEYDLPRKSVYKTRYAVATAINDTMLGFKILIELITEINQNNQP